MGYIRSLLCIKVGLYEEMISFHLMFIHLMPSSEKSLYMVERTWNNAWV